MKSIILPFLIFLSFSVFAQTEAPVNPEFSNYINAKYAGTIQRYSNGHPLGEIPLMNKPNFDALANTKINHTKNLVATYDLRSHNGTTPVGNQIASGPCWSFASIGSIESVLKYNGYGTYDLSEINQAACHGHDWAPCDGGNFELATNYASRIAGPINETDQPYPSTESGVCNSTCSTGHDPVYWMSNIVWLPGKDDTGFDMDAIKQAVQDNGAVYCNMCYDDTYMNYSDDTYYYTGSASTNHGVLIVGWDDTKSTDASSPGAWIIKNSWGASWGESGYFYISYYDTKALTTVGYFKDPVSYDASAHLYHYDEIGEISGIGYGDGDDYGLVKIVPDGDEQITKISTYVRGAGATINIQIYDNFSGGTLSNLLGSLTNQSVTYPGFYTFDLSSAIDVSSGDDFYVKVEYNTPGSNYCIPVETDYPGYASPTISNNVCWYSGSGSSWTEAGASGYDVCIRAYTIPQEVTYNVTFNVDDGSNPIDGPWVNFDGVLLKSDANGQIIFTGYSNGIYNYSITKSGYQTVKGSVTISGTDEVKNITMVERTYHVKFEISDGTSPISGAYITINGNTLKTYSGGVRTFSGFSPETYSYSVTKTAYEDASGSVTIAGASKTVSITLVPSTISKLNASSCGSNHMDLYDWIKADKIINYEMYEFEFTDQSTGIPSYRQVAFYGTRLISVPGMQNDKTYNVRVRVRVGGTWHPYGDICQISTNLSKSAMTNEIPITKEFHSKVYPNPFNNNFTLDIDGDSITQVNLYITDITGKILYEETVTPLQGITLGNKLAKGMYILVIKGSYHSESFRIIKTE